MIVMIIMIIRTKVARSRGDGGCFRPKTAAQTMPKCRACHTKCTPYKKCSACHAKGHPNNTANLSRALGRGEPRRLEAALSHLAVHLPKPRVRSGAGRSEGPWICAVDEEVHEVPDRARHAEHARVVQEVGGGVRRGALTRLPTAKSSATSRHRLHKADGPLDHVRAHAKRESWRAVRGTPGLRACAGDVLQ